MRANAFAGIDGHRQPRNRTIIGPGRNRRQVDTSSIPQKSWRCRKGHVAAIAHNVMPGHFPRLPEMAFGVCHVINGPDHDAIVALRCLSQSRAFGCRQGLLRIQECPGPDDREVPRNSDGVIEATIFQIKLLPKIGQSVPSRAIIIHAQTRVPLSNLVNFTLARWGDSRTTSPLSRDCIVPLDFDDCDAMSIKGSGQSKLHPGVGNQRRDINFMAALHNGNTLDFHAGSMTTRWEFTPERGP